MQKIIILNSLLPRPINIHNNIFSADFYGPGCRIPFLLLMEILTWHQFSLCSSSSLTRNTKLGMCGSRQHDTACERKSCNFPLPFLLLPTFYLLLWRKSEWPGLERHKKRGALYCNILPGELFLPSTPLRYVAFAREKNDRCTVKRSAIIFAWKLGAGAHKKQANALQLALERLSRVAEKPTTL